MTQLDTIVVIDFGSQYTQLIARRIREENVYCEIIPCTANFQEIKGKNPKGIILSGGPSSVYESFAPKLPIEIFSLKIPVLGICYGMQLLAKHFDSPIQSSDYREYGLATIEIITENVLIDTGVKSLDVWMSHGDSAEGVTEPFRVIAHSHKHPAIIAHKELPIWGIQFHPEVSHSENGQMIFKNFLSQCECSRNWNMETFFADAREKLSVQLRGKKVILGLSGGVDSTVTASLLHKVLGDNLYCIFINNGLLRLNENEEVLQMFKTHFKFNVIYKDATSVFLAGLKGVIDPEEKRKIIGRIFIETFEQVAKEIQNVDYLAQGTLYPDVIESVSFKGPSVTIKSHHNVGGLPEKMNLKLVEPLRELFKDEVRKLGNTLNIPATVLGRHPFPGPGLAVRILGEITEERLETLKKADHIFIDELRKNGLYDKIWQAFAVLLPIQSVGVMGDSRTYEQVLALRAVDSKDGMTASCHPIDHAILHKISTRIINEVKGINRVAYDISSKPPSTIEWE